jgi:dihydrofolate synthase/folylpolyglutamate synthase
MIIDVGLKTAWFKDVATHLVGPHQINNACISILLAQEWCHTHYPNISKDRFEKAVKSGLSKAKWPGRFEKIYSEPDVYIDVGHSPDAIEACLKTVNATLKGQKILLVTGVSHNKNREEIISRLVTVADEVICTRAYHMGSVVSDIEKIVTEKRPTVPCSCADTIEMAMSLAMTRAQKKGMTVLVAGGLFLSIEAQQAVNNRDPKALKFF